MGRQLGVSGSSEVECRPTQISQFLLKLLNHSHDAIEKLPTPWIRLEVEHRGAVSQIVFRITDSGTGIPPAIREKLMQPFFTTKDFGKGTGLGLSISRGIAEAHGGALRHVADAPNTCFELHLPLRQPQVPTSSAGRPA